MDEKVSKKTEQEILYEAYLKYPVFCKAKKQTEKQIKVIKNDLILKTDKLLLFFRSSSTTIIEKDKFVRQGKLVYMQYCSFVKGNPTAINDNLKNKIDLLLNQITDREAEQLTELRKKMTGGSRLDLDAIFKDEDIAKKLVNMSIEKLITEALKDSRFTIVSKTEQKVYITETGNKYHKSNCPYCKGKKLVPVTFTRVENAGYEPCKCINTSNKMLISKIELSENDKLKLNAQTMTAFIDESVRFNPWIKWDNSLPEKQASYSYVICKGALDSENEISTKNKVSYNACMSNEAQDVTFSAIEAISTVLLKIAFNYNFHGNVIIYTDNTAAKDNWYRNNSNLYLASLFENVKVCYIPREKNTIADRIGREQAFINIPSRLIGELVNKCMDYDKVCEELNFVKEYFPNPKKNIPNLIAELQLLSEEKEGMRE